MSRSLVALALLSACSGTPELLPLPAVEGLQALPDLDPADDVVEVELVAAPTRVSWLDGTTTDVWAYNGVVPGPVLTARVGDTVRVRFTNDLTEPTTIHWHGLRIPDVMDGVPAIQDPIQPGETFTYEFVVPDAGTFWYHPHVRGHEQIERGLHGMLVVHEAEPLQDVPQRGFVLDDALLDDSGAWYTFDVDNSHPLQVHGRNGNVLLVNGQVDPVEGTVSPGVAERWRLVNTANARNLWVQVEGADWRVVGVDGGLVAEPYTAERVLLPPGRRFDLEVIPKGSVDAVQLLVALPNQTGGWDTWPMFEAGLDWENPGTGAAPAWSLPEPFTPEPTTQDVELEFDVEGGGANIHWTINGATWEEHQAIHATGHTPTRIVVRELSGAFHPFHLHGQFFRVIERNSEPADEPGWQDTVLLNGDDEVVLYSELDNPGRWMTHCHILEHAERGMMTELVVE